MGVGIGGEIFFGFFEGGVGVTDILVLKIKWTGAKSDFLIAVVVDDVDDDVAESEFFEIFEGCGNESVVASFIGGKNLIAKFSHFEMIDAKQSSIYKQKRDKCDEQVPGFDFWFFEFKAF